MYGCMDVWMDGCMDVWMYGCMDGWMDGWMDGGTLTKALHKAAMVVVAGVAPIVPRLFTNRVAS